MIISERHWQLGEVPKTGSEQMSLIFRKGMKDDLGSYRLVSFTWIPRKALEQMILEATAKQRKDTVTGSSQQGFMKEKSCSRNQISFYDERTSG